MRIMNTMKKFPAGMMVIPLLLGCVINTIAPDILQVGSFTTGIFSNAAVKTVVGLFLFCSGSQIDIKMAGATVYRGVVLTILKFGMGFAVGMVFYKLLGGAAFLGLTPLAMIAGITNSNGVIYATLASQYGEDVDVGATSILAINDPPFLTMVALGASGMGTFPVMDIVAGVIPMILGFIIGNIDHEWRKVLGTGMILLPPFNGFALGSGMNLKNIASSGFGGIVLGVMTVLFTGLVTFVIYSLIRRKADPMGAAIGTTAGVATMTPAAVAMSDATFATQVDAATAQIAASVVITAIVCPLLVAFLYKFSKKFNDKHGLGKPKNGIIKSAEKETATKATAETTEMTGQSIRSAAAKS